MGYIYSGMLHTGFDAPANSLELHCIKRCVDNIFPVLDALRVPYKQNGSIMVAWNSEQVNIFLHFFSASERLSSRHNIIISLFFLQVQV
jgi:glycerol-3-phosphate dehydrogenase